MLLKSEIEQCVKEQRDYLNARSTGMERTALGTLQLGPEFVQIITGIRRCGKSTLMSQLCSKGEKNYAYFSFEDPRVLAFEAADFPKLEEALGEKEQYFFDEIQNVPQWEIFIRHLHNKGKSICITGSNATLLSRELGTRLTGRNIQNELFPFSFKEFCDFLNLEMHVESFTSYLSLGGFPDFLKTREIAYLQQLFKDILFQDIIVKNAIRNAKLVEQICLFLISNIGKVYSLNGIKKTFGVGSANSVADYISWFEESYLLFSVPRFSWSLKSMAVNPKKVYTIDTGFAKANSLSFSKDHGRLLENAVFLQLRSYFKEIFYFSEKYECDFVLRQKNTITTAIQVCTEVHLDNKHRELKGLLEALHFFNLEMGYILTMDQKDTFLMEGKTIEILPAWKWMNSIASVQL